MSARIKLSEREADKLLDQLCESTGTDREFWEQIADDFEDAVEDREGTT